MRILHLTPTYFPSVGGIEVVIRNLCRELLSRGIQSDVGHIASGNCANISFMDGVLVRNIPLLGTQLVGFAPHLESVVKNYDLIHVHDPQLMAITANLCVFGRRKPAVLSTHGGYHHTRNYSRIKKLHELAIIRRLLSRYNLVLATSKPDLTWISSFTNRVVLCENGVDTNSFMAISPSIQKSPWKWLYWGRLSRNKRLDDAVLLASKFRSLGAPITFVICGQDFDGSGPALENACKGKNWITIEPMATQERLADLISGAGIFVTASEHEGFGLTVIEALASGLPVICRNIPPLNEFIDDECGIRLDFRFDPPEMTKLQDFINRLPSSYQQMTVECRRRADTYSWDAAIGNFIRAYKMALDNNS